MSFRVILRIVFLLAMIAGSAMATPLTVQIKDSLGGFSTEIDSTALVVDVPITLRLYATSDVDLFNLEMKIESLNGTGVFALLSRTFDQAAGWNGYPLSFTGPDDMIGDPNGQSSQKIGCLSWGDYVAAGTSSYATINAIVKAGTPVGEYRLNVNSVEGGDYPDGYGVYGSGGQDYIVNVVPEPTTLLLFGCVVPLIRRRRVSVS